MGINSTAAELAEKNERQEKEEEKPKNTDGNFLVYLFRSNILTKLKTLRNQIKT
jgi:hypothetical protein